MKGRRYNSNFQQTIYEDLYVVSMCSCLHQFIGYLRGESGVCKRGASRLREVCMIDNHHYINKRPKARHHNELWSFQQYTKSLNGGGGLTLTNKHTRNNKMSSDITLEAPFVTYELRQIFYQCH